MNLLELKYVELSGKITLLEQQHEEVFKQWHQLKAELKAVEAKLNITNQIEENN